MWPFGKYEKCQRKYRISQDGTGYYVPEVCDGSYNGVGSWLPLGVYGYKHIEAAREEIQKDKDSRKNLV